MTREDAITQPKSRVSKWKQNPTAVREDILNMATVAFAANGLAGARIDEIAHRTTASKRMIYYYFGDKEGLYRAVLERAYTALGQSMKDHDITHADPLTALRDFIEATFENHMRAPDFIRLVMIENIHNASFLRECEKARALAQNILGTLDTILKRGKESGAFRPDADPLELYWFISALSFYNVSNKATFSVSFGDALFSGEQKESLKRRAVDVVISSVATPS